MPHRLDRREFLALSAAAWVARPQDRSSRLSRVIEQYDAQGVHRTGTDVDMECARWLAEEGRRAGAETKLVSFPFSRIDPGRTELAVGDRRVEGLPLFDGAFTDEEGVEGRLEGLDRQVEIGVTRVPPHRTLPGGREIEVVRRVVKARGLVAICDGAEAGIPAGLTPINADAYENPYGPPVLQLSTGHGAWLEQAIFLRQRATLFATVERTEVEALNVEARLPGSGERSSPLVVIASRSGWWRCASERGGGLAVWLELIRALSGMNRRRDVVLVASTGHETAHVGMSRFLATNLGIVREAHAFLSLGANLAASETTIRLEASHKEFEQLAGSAMRAAGSPPDETAVVGLTPPFGDARQVFDSGGSYVSVVGTRNPFFHHPDDRFPAAVNLDRLTRLTEAFVAMAARFVA